MPRVAEGLLTTNLNSLAFSIYDDASEEGLPRDADSAKSKAIHWAPHVKDYFSIMKSFSVVRFILRCLCVDFIGVELK
ncbi:hypothetical protein L0F63_000314, partial [Massospora cicadina]